MADTAISPKVEGRRRYAPQILLAAGWLGLFAYCVAYLTEDLPFQTQPAQLVGDSLVDQIEDLPRQMIGSAGFEAPTAPAIPATGIAPSVENKPALAVAEAPLPAPAATSHPASVVAEYVGTWGPTADGWSAVARRKGYLPAIITPEHAKAGDTVCSFRDAHRTGNTWTMAADCGDQARRWSSRVRLVVEGDHLTWSSASGSSAYIRCNRRAG